MCVLQHSTLYTALFSSVHSARIIFIPFPLVALLRFSDKVFFAEADRGNNIAVGA